MQLGRINRRQSGVTMLEVLIAIVIVSIGLLGLAGLFSFAGKAELESYQRVQALSYLKDMEDRIATNRRAAQCYVSVNYGGHGALPSCVVGGAGAGTTEQQAVANADFAAWNAALLGAAERTASSANAGGIVGARGCVQLIGTATLGSPVVVRDYRVSVAWQGMEDSSPPSADYGDCGTADYAAVPGRRRVVSSILRIPEL